LYNSSRLTAQNVKLSRITATKPTSRMDTRLEVLQCKLIIVQFMELNCKKPVLLYFY